MNETRWRKSTYSSNGGASCIEVGQAARIIAVRDTKQHGRGPVLRFTPEAWRRFADQVKRSLASRPELASIDACRGHPSREGGPYEHFPGSDSWQRDGICCRSPSRRQRRSTGLRARWSSRCSATSAGELALRSANPHGATSRPPVSGPVRLSPDRCPIGRRMLEPYDTFSPARQPSAGAFGLARLSDAR
jgi:Domain of unknown function (DUF397)